MLRRAITSLAPTTRTIAPRVFQRSMAEEAKGGIPTKLTLNLLAPHDAIFHKKEVDMVIIPGAAGMFGVLPGHVPTISELKPGLLEVTVAPGDIQKFFISSGFAFAHSVRVPPPALSPMSAPRKPHGPCSVRVRYKHLSQQICPPSTQPQLRTPVGVPPVQLCFPLPPPPAPLPTPYTPPRMQHPSSLLVLKIPI